jgi:hypothetical protein
VGGKRYPLAGNGKTTSTTGSDAIGGFTEHRTAWAVGGGNGAAATYAFETAIRAYPNCTTSVASPHATAQSCIIFEQHWPNGAENTTVSSPHGGGVVANYPSFALDNVADRGFLTFGGRQLEDCFAGALTNAAQIPTGDGGGGPLAVFDKDGPVRVFRRNFALEDAIGSRACSLEASMRVTNGMPFLSDAHSLTG